MKKQNKLILVSLVALLSTAGTTVALAKSPITANIGITSNYIWRGVTQSNDISAVSGGVDYAHSSGAYVGIWQSSLAGNDYEQDIYGGYKFKAGPVALDAGYIKYMYPAGNVTDFDEAYFNASYKMFSTGIAVNTDKEGGAQTGDKYFYGAAEFEVKKDLILGVKLGRYDFKAGGDYTHYGLNLSKDDFKISYDKNNLNGVAGDARLSVSWGKNFDL